MPGRALRATAIPFLGALAFLSIALPCQPALAAKTLPQAPYYYVLDEPRILSPHALRALQTLLIEHDRSTGEQVLVAIFNSLDGEDLVSFTNRAFNEWKIGKRGKDNGALLALYWKDRKARIEVGYGLEPVLTDAKSKRVLEDFLIPELKVGKPDRAVSLAALEILKTLESPLTQDGKAQEILRSGGFRGGFRPTAGSGQVGFPFILLFIGLILLSMVLKALTAAEAHYTGRGWYRPNPWRRPQGWHSGGWGTGGGWGGGFGGGGGGFSGGGGRSGGGGASGSW